MAIRLVGELLSPISCPMANVTIKLKALDTSASVLFSSEASVKTDYKGRYEFTVPTGLYLVSLDNGISQAELGQIQVYSDSTESTLQALLDAPQTEPSPVWLQQLEEKLAEATRQAGLAAQSASDAANTAKSVTETADAAKQHADRAYASSTSASQSKLDAEDAATRAELAASSVPEIAQSAVDKITDVADKTNIAINDATDAAQSAEASANKAKAEADRAKDEADRASAITGLDTVEDAVSDALSRSYQYAMTKSNFDALREKRKSDHAGSGFLEFGKHYSSYGFVNEGIWSYAIDQSNILGFGRGVAEGGDGSSRTSYPIALVDGVPLSIANVTQIIERNAIKFPQAPNGTKTYDSATGAVVDYMTDVDPRYGDVADTKEEAILRAFEFDAQNSDFRYGKTFWAVYGSPIWSIGNGGATLTYNSENGGVQQIESPYGRYDSGEFEVIYVIDEITSHGGTLVVDADGTSKVAQKITETGTYVFRFTCTNNYQIKVRLASEAGSEIKIGWISWRKISNNVITSRQDLVFIESWHEDVSKKGVLLPYGNVQFGSTSWNGITLKKLDDLGVGQGYSAFGEWDTKTVGHAIKIAELTDTQLQRFLSEPANNIYYDSELKKLVQVRYRIRVVEGINDSPYLVTPKNNNLEDAMTWRGSKFRIARNEGSEIAADYKIDTFFFSDGNSGSPRNRQEPALFAYAGNYGLSSAMPIALVQRMNKGAFHPAYNPLGCDIFSDSRRWDATQESVTSPKDCFSKALHHDPFFSDSGSVSSGQSGRVDAIKYHDAIYATLVHDLRLSARNQDANLLRENAIRDAISGTMRGKGKIPFLNADLTQSTLTAEFDTVPMCDILGSNADIQRIFKNGVLGTKISDGNLSRKAISADATVITGDGATWTSKAIRIDAVKNAITHTVPSGQVALIFYETLSSFTEISNNASVVGSVGDVFTSSHNTFGNRLNGSLVGGVGKGSGHFVFGNSTMLNNVLDNNKLNFYLAQKHQHLSASGVGFENNSGAFKALSTITEKGGLLYLQFHGCELKYAGSSWGDNTVIPVVNGEGTKTDTNGNTVKTFCHHSIFPLGIADSQALASLRIDNRANISDDINSGLHFDCLEDVPEPIREFYWEEAVILQERWIEESGTNEFGEDVINRIPDHVMGVHVHKHPHPHESGGHISDENIQLWQFHDDFKDWLQTCATIKFEAAQEGEESERVPLPPMPIKSDYIGK